MANKTPQSTKVILKLNNGIVDGKQKTVDVSIGPLSVTGYDPDKALAVAGALEACLSKSVYILQETITSNLEPDGAAAQTA